MDIDQIKLEVKGKKILNIRYTDAFHGNELEIILEDGSSLFLNSMTGIGLNTKY